MKLSEKFEEALIYATRAHGNQTRKKTGIPYVAHILGVTAIALEYGANETEAIGALLHDTVEDCGGAERLRDIRKKFGDDVASISRIPILRHGWYRPLTNCITRGRSSLSFDDMVWKCSSALRGKRMGRFGITARLSLRFASMVIMPISSTNSIGW